MRKSSIRKPVVKKNTLGGRLIGALFGIGLFLGSFAVLWFNEGRIDYGKVAEDSQLAQLDSLTTNLEGVFIAGQGDLTSPESIGDPLFLAPQAYIALNRKVEMYAWEEDEREEDDATYYDYSTDWTENPEDSSRFEYPSGHTNPPKPVENASFLVTTAQVGAYQIDPAAVELPPAETVNLGAAPIYPEVSSQDGGVIVGNYIFLGAGTLDQPAVGDVRISFTAVPQTPRVTIFGQVSGDRIIPHPVRESDSLYRIFNMDREAAIEKMHQEYTTALWLTRLGGFAMMWCGLFLILNPITFFLAFLPLLERAGNWVLMVITLPVAGALSAVTIAIAFLLHNPVVLVILACLVFVLIGMAFAGAFVLSRRSKA